MAFATTSERKEALEKAKARVKRLLSMAKDTSSPHEAAIAAERARKLIDEYQIDEFELTESISEELKQEGAGRYFAAMPQHLSFLGTRVAQYNDCQCRFGWGDVSFKKRDDQYKQMGKRIEFWGYETDVHLALAMYEYLCDSIDNMCKIYLKDKGFSKYPVRIGGEFKKGMALEICRRLADLTQTRDELSYTGNGTGLMVVKQQGLEAAFGKVKYSKLNMRQVQDRDEAEARLAGRISGSTLEIVKSLKEENEQRKIS